MNVSDDQGAIASRPRRNQFGGLRTAGRALIYTYLGIGGLFGVISIISNIFYYAWGPGALWWNIDALGLYAFVGAGIGFAMGIFGAVLRAFLWPISLWIALSGNEPFLRWLLFPWFEPGV